MPVPVLADCITLNKSLYLSSFSHLSKGLDVGRIIRISPPI